MLQRSCADVEAKWERSLLSHSRGMRPVKDSSSEVTESLLCDYILAPATLIFI